MTTRAGHEADFGGTRPSASGDWSDTSHGGRRDPDTGPPKDVEALPRVGRPVGRDRRTRDRILDAAEALISRHGVEGLRLKDVAASVGIRPPSIFSHFAGRDAVARAVGERVRGAMQAPVPFEEGDDPWHYVRHWTRRLVVTLAGNPAHVRLLLRDLMQTGVAGSYGGDADPRGPAAFYAAIEAGMTAGTFRPVRPASVLAQLLGAILASVAWDGWDDEGRPRLAIAVADLEREAEELLSGYLRR